MSPEQSTEADERKLQTATFGGGCFWCLEAVFQEVEGVVSVKSGYAGGHTERPTYVEVCSGTTGHAEVVQVMFDPEVTAFEDLLRIFFTIHDPTTKDRQGADVGAQYRSIVLFHSRDQESAVREMIGKVEAAGLWEDPVVTEVKWLGRFWPAEEEHDDYFRRHPEKAYCRVVIAPKMAEFRKAFPGKRRTDDGE